MTKRERANPDLLQASRKRRIASGAGREVQELNQLLKMHRQMADMMKKMGKMGKGGMLKQAMKGLMGKSPGEADPAAIHDAARQIQSKLPGLGGFGPGAGSALPPGLSGFGKKK
jgi:signal recognition particle subunit SRP54